VVFVTHTSFQLYHCLFSQEYLRDIHDMGNVSGNGVTLSASSLYDFCDPVQRGEWLDVFIALIEFLRSGESRVGFLNRFHPRNMLHKVYI
jgi:hypothetical protein